MVAVFGGKDVAERGGGKEEARLRGADKFASAQNACGKDDV